MGLAFHFFSIAQGFFAVLVLAVVAAALLLAASVVRVALAGIGWRLNRLRKRATVKPHKPARPRPVEAEPEPAPEDDAAEWLKDFG